LGGKHLVRKLKGHKLTIRGDTFSSSWDENKDASLKKKVPNCREKKREKHQKGLSPGNPMGDAWGRGEA